MYFELVVTFIVGAYLFESLLNVRQYSKFFEKMPKEITSFCSKEKYAKANSYGIDKMKFQFVLQLYGLLETLCILYFGVLVLVWNQAGNISRLLGYDASYEIVQSLIFTTLFSGISMLLHLPFSLYSTFVIEERHGFNKQTLKLFFTDMAKNCALFIIIGLPIIAILLTVIKASGQNFYWFVWLAMTVIQFLLLAIYPTFIAPIFNKFTPLEEGPLKKMIEALAKKNSFPLTKLFVVDGSKRSSHSNAYFYGFFKSKRIVLYDTLLKQTNHEEICAVLGHEIGHWKESHFYKMLAVNQIHLFFIFYLFGQFINNKTLYSSFGFTETPILIGFILFQFVYSPVESILGFLMNLLSRKHEFEADLFSVNLGYSDQLKSGLIKLQLENLGVMNPDKWYSSFHYSHPPLTERLKAIDSYKKE